MISVTREQARPALHCEQPRHAASGGFRAIDGSSGPPLYKKTPADGGSLLSGGVGTNWIRRGATGVAAQSEMMLKNRQGKAAIRVYRNHSHYRHFGAARDLSGEAGPLGRPS